MTVTYSAAFDVRALRDGSTATEAEFDLTMTSAALGDIEIDSSDFSAFFLLHDYIIGGAVNHEGGTVSSLSGFSATQTLSAALESIITAKMASVSPAWTGAIDVSFSGGVYTISRSSGSFTFAIAFGNAQTRGLLGYTGNQSAGTSHTGTLTASHYIIATQGGRSDDLEGDFEPDDIAALAVSDDATAFVGIARSTSPKYRTWVQQFEVKRKVFKAFAESPDLWTFERLREHCRCSLPFVVSDGDEIMVCVLLPSSAASRGKIRPGGPGDDVHFHIPFSVLRVARLTPG